MSCSEADSSPTLRWVGGVYPVPWTDGMLLQHCSSAIQVALHPTPGNTKKLKRDSSSSTLTNQANLGMNSAMQHAVLVAKWHKNPLMGWRAKTWFLCFFGNDLQFSLYPQIQGTGGWFILFQN